jgi:hypothetical protein
MINKKESKIFTGRSGNQARSKVKDSRSVLLA